MATKTDFTPDQWEALAFAVTDTMMFVTMANGTHFWESMSETTAAARYLLEQAKTSASTLVRDLAVDAGRHRDKTIKSDDIEPVTMDRVAAAFAIIREVAPDEAEAFKALVLGVADAAAEAKNGIDDAESNAIDKVKSALL
ncbi:MAG: hypothetical protein P4L93_04700 [Coriobacteriia bacterium]|nr:hypothetical protein [Coriobacteriia bacterium]